MKLIDIIFEDETILDGVQYSHKTDQEWLDGLKIKFPNWDYSNAEIYKGDDSVGKRALRRVLMRKQLEQMGVELRELMVYQSPPELGALYTEVAEMMLVVGKEQKVLITKQIQIQAIQDQRREAKRKQSIKQAFIGVGIIIVITFYGFAMMFVAQLRYEMYPQYGNEFIPKTDEQRHRDAQPQVYVGR